MMKPSLQLRIGQQLTMTPQLQQAIRLLQLPTIELQAQIREALESNVMLEAEDDGEEGLSLEELAASSDERAADPADQAADRADGRDQRGLVRADCGGVRRPLVGRR